MCPLQTLLGNRQFQKFLVFPSVCLPPLILRLLLIGGPPCTDEGIYAFWSQMIFNSIATTGNIPDVGAVSLYSILGSWVFTLPGESFFWLRALDGLFASAVSWQIFRLFEQESRNVGFSVLLTFLISLFINDPVFINYGNKNPIFLALVPLLMAVRLALTPTPANGDKGRVFFLCGALTALAALLREPFIVFPFIFFIYFAFTTAVKRLVAFSLGTVTSGFSIVFALWFLRGFTPTILDAYLASGRIFANINHDIYGHLYQALTATGEVCWTLAPLLILLPLSFFLSPERKKHMAKFTFLLLIFLSPLPETLYKISFPYHFGISIVGAGALIALCYGAISQSTSRNLRWFTGALLVLAVLLSGGRYPLWKAHSDFAKHFAPTMIWSDWENPAIKDSTYLSLAKQVRDVKRTGDRLMVSGAFFAVFPLAEILPTKIQLADLDWISFSHPPSALPQIIAEAAPQILVFTVRNTPGFSNFESLLTGLIDYQRIYDLPVDMSRSYGNISGQVWLKMPSK